MRYVLAALLLLSAGCESFLITSAPESHGQTAQSRGITAQLDEGAT